MEAGPRPADEQSCGLSLDLYKSPDPQNRCLPCRRCLPRSLRQTKADNADKADGSFQRPLVRATRTPEPAIPRRRLVQLAAGSVQLASRPGGDLYNSLRWSIETGTRIRHTSLSPKALPRNSSRVAGGVHRRWTASSHTRTYRFRVKRDTPRSPYAARFSVMTGRCFLPCRNSSLTCTAPLVDSIGAGGEAQGNVLRQRGRGSNLGCSHAGDRSR